MKSLYTFTHILIILAISAISPNVNARTWDFSSVTATDQNNLNADPANWQYETTNNRWLNNSFIENSPLTANGTELEFTQGLRFTISGNDALRVDSKGKRMALNKSVATVIIPDLKAGETVSIQAMTSKSGVARGFEGTNLTIVSGFAPTAEKTQHVATVTNDGDVTFHSTGGMYVYSISVTDDNDGDIPSPTPSTDHSVKMDATNNQMLLRTTTGELKYYNTKDLAEVSIDKNSGSVTVNPKTNDWTDEFKQNITAISFAKAPENGDDAEINNRGVNITEAKGWLESAYLKWEPLSDATSYRVYIKGGKYTDYTIIDRELVRDYGTYGRADMVGLPAGVYAMKVVPIINNTEDESRASEAIGMTVKPHDRSGFAFHNFSGVGAYKDNGELKDDARVIYVTAETAKTVTCNVRQSANDGDGTPFTGLQAILGAFQKGTETRPLAVRIVGCIKDTDMDSFLSSAEGIQIKGKGNYSPMNITIEGIGDDAATWGFGFLVRNCSSVEFRNFANMLCMDDALSFDTANSHCWVHHLDFFYGNTGGDSDQAKGDGTVDMKGHSRYMTIAYNHFWDNGKTSLCGMKSESNDDYVDYHHNWFDHSDSRHPRVRTMTVHVWNNYYDGVAKYGAGATMGSSVFVEGNFFRHTKNTMLISLQGTDGKGAGTFSGEAGGMIKSYGNVYAEKGSNSNYTPITHKVSANDFDCYEASSSNERVPESFVTKSGGTTYNNFDTDPTLMYEYTAVEATEVPTLVTGYYGAGRLNKGDFTWDMNYPDADTDYSVISELKTALKNYRTSLVRIYP